MKFLLAIATTSLALVTGFAPRSDACLVNTLRCMCTTGNAPFASFVRAVASRFCCRLVEPERHVLGCNREERRVHGLGYGRGSTAAGLCPRQTRSRVRRHTLLDPTEHVTSTGDRALL